MHFWRAKLEKLHMGIKKPAIMLNSSLSSSRIWKQNFKMFNVQRKHVFWRKIYIFWHFFADDIKNNDFL